MQQRTGKDWAKKHGPKQPPADLPPPPPERLPPIQSSSPMTCDRVIRIPRKAYDLLHSMKARAVEKASGGEDVGISVRISLGRMALKAFQEFAVNHDLLPKAAAGGVR